VDISGFPEPRNQRHALPVNDMAGMLIERALDEKESEKH